MERNSPGVVFMLYCQEDHKVMMMMSDSGTSNTNRNLMVFSYRKLLKMGLEFVLNSPIWESVFRGYY